MFEGYIGIPLDEGLFAEDLILCFLLALFITFAWVYRTNIQLFFKMLKDLWQVKARQNLFEDISGNEFFYGNFMTFQTLSLTTLFIFSFGCIEGYINYAYLPAFFISLFSIYLFITVFYLLKKAMYNLLGFVFADPEKFSLWKSSYHASIRTWGITLYLPVLWMVFLESYYWIPILMFVFLYILCRFVILYKSIQIFFTKNHGLFFISLYLCAVEILPLILLCQGLINLYNFIETSALWH